jgi:hypothetical protein
MTMSEATVWKSAAPLNKVQAPIKERYLPAASISRDGHFALIA